MTEPRPANALGTLREGWSLFVGSERRRILLLAPIVAAIGVLEVVALASAMPLVAIIIDPDALGRWEILGRLRARVGGADLQGLVALLTALVVVALIVATVASYLKDYAIARFAAGCWTRLGHDLMKSSLDAPYVWFLQRNASVLTRLFTHDLVLWARDFVEFLLTFLSDFVIVATAIVVILAIAPAAGLAAIAAVLVIYGGILLWIRPRLQGHAEVSRRKSDQLALSAHEAFSGAKDIRLSSQEAFFVSAFSRANAKVANARVMTSVWGKIAPLLMLLLGQLALVVMAFGLWWAKVPTAEIAATMAVIVLVSARLIPALNRIAANVNKIWNVGPYVTGINEVSRSLHAAMEVQRAEWTGEGRPVPADWRRLEAEGIDFGYGSSGALVLNGISLVIERGRTYGIIGPSGAGKSTLVDVLLGLLDPVGGKLFLEGQPLTGIDKTSWQARLGYVPQAPFISDDTLRANVAFGVSASEADDKRVTECLEAANLSQLLDELPSGLDTRMGDRGSRLSGGQKQRLAIARALYKQPDILVLDEATSSLDTLNELAIQLAIQRLRGKVTLVIVAHRLSTIRDADHVFVLDNGRLVDEGTYDSLRTSSPLFARLVAAQSDHALPANEPIAGPVP